MGIPAALVVAALVAPAGLAWANAASNAPSEVAPVSASTERASTVRGSPPAGGVTILAQPRAAGPRDGTTDAPGRPSAADASGTTGGTVWQPRSAAWGWPVSGPLRGRSFDPPGVRWGAGHRGVDLEVPVGGAVRAPADGVVSFAGPVAGRDVLVVTSAGGLRSTFEPVAAAVPVGTAVAAGDVVGALTAAPGHCVPLTCLHWGVLRGSEYLDPLGFVRSPVVLLPVE